MPELPEAETIGRALQNALKGEVITRVEIFSPAMRTPLEPLKHAALPGRTILDVRRRGRYLVAELDDGRGLLMHFGMSGVVRVEPPSVPRRKHEHIFLHLSNGKIFRFECPRRFSIFEVHPGCAGGKFPAMLDKLGVEPLSRTFTGKYLFQAFRNRTAPVKTLLMDNLIVAGIGNIYANETLFAAGIDPRRSGGDCSLAECTKIVRAAKKILTMAIEAGGTTISDYRQVDGSEGKFAANLKIYGRNGEKCLRCGETIRLIRIGGRSTCFCGKCQK